MEFEEYDIIVIGGGIIGLATAMQLTQGYPGYKIAVLEKESKLAQHQTGHNSGVIHAGIYYAPGSSKGNLCVSGGEMLIRFCDKHSIPYKICGKLIVATNQSQLQGLNELHRRGTANGARGLEVVGPEKLKELEPHAAGIKGIYSPNTGIVDFSAVTKAYAREMVETGGNIFIKTKVLKITKRSGTLYIHTNNGEMKAKNLINCAGLYADRIARSMGANVDLRIVPFRGEYYSIRSSRSNLVNSLIYPVPDPKMPFLGVHFTRRIDGTIEAGPNAVLALAREGYQKMNMNKGDILDILAYPGFWRMSKIHWQVGMKEVYRSLFKRAFHKSLQKLVPDIKLEDLCNPGAGVRAQAIDRKGKLLQDFSIARSPNAIHVLNAPSPAATASLAISQHITYLAQKSFGLPKPAKSIMEGLN